MSVQFKGTLEINDARGEVIFHPEDGSAPPFRLEGVKAEIKDGKLLASLHLSLNKPVITAHRANRPIEVPPTEDKA